MFTTWEMVFLLAVLSSTASGYFVSIDAQADECFYERVNSGTKMGLMFEVAEGGFLDIDVEVRRPRERAGAERSRRSNAYLQRRRIRPSGAVMSDAVS